MLLSGSDLIHSRTLQSFNANRICARRKVNRAAPHGPRNSCRTFIDSGPCIATGMPVHAFDSDCSLALIEEGCRFRSVGQKEYSQDSKYHSWNALLVLPSQFIAQKVNVFGDNAPQQWKEVSNFQWWCAHVGHRKRSNHQKLRQQRQSQTNMPSVQICIVINEGTPKILGSHEEHSLPEDPFLALYRRTLLRENRLVSKHKREATAFSQKYTGMAGPNPDSNMPKKIRATMRPGKLKAVDWGNKISNNVWASRTSALTIMVDDKPQPIAEHAIQNLGWKSLETIVAGTWNKIYKEQTVRCLVCIEDWEKYERKKRRRPSWPSQIARQ